MDDGWWVIEGGMKDGWRIDRMDGILTEEGRMQGSMETCKTTNYAVTIVQVW